MRIVVYIVEILATFVEVFIGYYFISGISGNNFKNRFRYILLTVIIAAIVLRANTIKLYSAWTTIIAFIFMVVTSVLVEHIKFVDSIAITAFYFILMYMFDFLTMSIQGVFKGNPLLPYNVVMHLSYERCIFLVASKFCLVCLSLIIRKLVYKWRLPFKSNIFLAASGTVVISFLGKQTLQGVNENIVTIWIMLLALLFSVFMLTNVFLAYQEMVRNHYIIETQNEILSDKIKYMMEADENWRRLKHDLNGHLLTIFGMLQKGQSLEAEEYINTLLEPAIKKAAVQWTGNEVVDFILDNYVEKTSKEHIRLDIDVDHVLFEGKEKKDLCVIFCNILENALEAVRLKKDGDRVIKISIRKFGEIILIQIKNTLSVAPEIKENILLTSKKDYNNHGLGLKNVEEVVNSYSGLMSYEFNREWFTIEISFFNSKSKENVCSP